MKKFISAFLAMVMVVIMIPVTSVIAEESFTEGYYTYTVTDGEATITKVDKAISGDIVIPETLGGYPVTNIGTEAFYYCENITTIIIPDSVVYISDRAFYNCKKITEIKIPNNVLAIGKSAFNECRKLKSVYIGNSVTTIGDSAFSNCYSITSLSIPKSITSIGFCAFYNAAPSSSIYIPNVYYGGTEQEWDNITMSAYNNLNMASYFHYNAPNPETHFVYTIITEPTCTENGKGSYVCSCGYSKKTETIPASHDPIHHEGKAPTCTETGWDAYETCSRCDYTTYSELPANGHKLVYHSAKSPTCTEGGWEAYETCENCDYTTYVEIRKHGHQYELNVCIHCGEREPIPYGDASGDGKINLADVSLMLKYIAKWNVELDTDAADVTCDGKVNLADVSLILKYIAKWDVVLGK